MGIIATLIIGAIAGWLGGTVYKGSGLGLLGNIVIGILGSGVGSWLLERVFKVSLGEGWIGVYPDRGYWSHCYFVLGEFDIQKEEIRKEE